MLQIEIFRRDGFGLSQSVTVARQNWVLLLQIEMFEEVSLQAEFGAYVFALEVGGAHS